MNYEAVITGRPDEMRLSELGVGEVAVITAHPDPTYVGRPVLGVTSGVVNLRSGGLWQAPLDGAHVQVRRLRPGEVVELRAK